MAKLTFNTDLCKGCGLCVDACPKHVISLVPQETVVAVMCHNRDKGAEARKACKNACIACKKCEKACPVQAIAVTDNLAQIDYTKCIGCGACVATCKNGSAMLFVSAKFSQLALLPQGQVETYERVQKMVARMDELGFGACTNTRACEMECPKHITVSHIARLNREFLCAKLQD